jgi:hypothetical protein
VVSSPALWVPFVAMESRQSSNLPVILVAALLLILPLAAYVGAYFGLSTGTSRNDRGGTCRVYRSSWQVYLFLPATFVESAVTGRDMSPAWTAPGVP